MPNLKPNHMNALRTITLGFTFFIVLASLSANPLSAQESNDPLTLQEQYEQAHNRTRIYEGFRAIRDDMFQSLRRNSLDSLRKAKQETQAYILQLEQTKASMDSLSLELQQAIDQRDQAISEKDSIFLLGLPVNKGFYNLVLWSIILGLVAVSLIILFLFQRANSITVKVNRELNDLQVEYEEYRKTSRERFEKQSIDHFNELRKLKAV